MVEKVLAIQNPFIKFIRLLHHQSIGTVYGKTFKWENFCGFHGFHIICKCFHTNFSNFYFTCRNASAMHSWSRANHSVKMLLSMWPTMFGPTYIHTHCKAILPVIFSQTLLSFMHRRYTPIFVDCRHNGLKHNASNFNLSNFYYC